MTQEEQLALAWSRAPRPAALCLHSPGPVLQTLGQKSHWSEKGSEPRLFTDFFPLRAYAWFFATGWVPAEQQQCPLQRPDAPQRGSRPRRGAGSGCSHGGCCGGPAAHEGAPQADLPGGHARWVQEPDKVGPQERRTRWPDSGTPLAGTPASRVGGAFGAQQSRSRPLASQEPLNGGPCAPAEPSLLQT